MLITILPISFILILVFVFFISKQKADFIDVIIKSVLVFSALVVFSTETLSYFQILSRLGLALFWSVTILFLLYILRRMPIYKLSHNKKIVVLFYNRFDSKDRIWLLGILLILLVVFFQGISYPPNNYDSMTYHMARIVHWISHGSLMNYHSNVIRQLYQPPGAEYVICQVCLLTGSDLFANHVQWFFLIATIFSSIGIASLLGVFRSGWIFIVVFVVTIPEILLQASSTQNDIVVSFFITASVYCLFRFFKSPNKVTSLFLGLSFGLSILTKATAYIFLAPLVLAIIIWCYKTIVLQKRVYNAKFLIIFIGVLFSVTINFYVRNYKLADTFLGTSSKEVEMYRNAKMNHEAVISNSIRNLSLNFTYPLLNRYSENAIRDILIFRYRRLVIPPKCALISELVHLAPSFLGANRRLCPYYSFYYI